MMDPYLIWSNEHNAWWRPDARGYTAFLKDAGRYTRDEALRHCQTRDQVPGRPLPELPVRQGDLEQITIHDR